MTKRTKNKGKILKEVNIENMKGNVLRCSCCGKPINTFLKNMSEYGWKIKKVKNKKISLKYFCSYTCYKKEIDKEEKIKDKKLKAKLLNKYNGVLTLPECLFMDELLGHIGFKRGTIPKVHIKTREDFEKFLDKYYDYAVEVIEDE